MKFSVFLGTICALLSVVLAVQKCCPQPENDAAGRCGCCPDACCCICSNMTIPGTTPDFTTMTPPMTTTSEICELTGLDVCLIIDNTASIGAALWTTQVLPALSALVGSPSWETVGNMTRFCFIDYDNDAELLWGINDPETNSLADLEAAIAAIPFKGGFTNTGSGLNLAAQQLMTADREDTNFPDVCMTFTDGNANLPTATAADQTDSFANAIPNLKAACDISYAVGIGADIDQAELEMIACDEPANVFRVDNFVELNERILEIVEDLRVRICETIVNPARTTPAPPTAGPPVVIEDCKCCCPPLPDPCDRMGADKCCCRFDTMASAGSMRRKK